MSAQRNAYFTDVFPSGCEGSSTLDENSLYYWSVDIQNADGTVLSSERWDFATAVGTKFTSTNLIWSTEGNSSLIRARVAKADGVTKALLTVTALGSDTVDTSKASGRYIFTAFVNNQEIGVGPTRRSSSKLFYNTYDITEQLAKGKANVLGLFSYAPGGTVSPGVLMQLTYFYSDGTSSVVYNSGSDVQNGSASTQAMSMDDIVYGTSGHSIGTQYYTENAQNVDVSAFPASWCDPDQVDGVDSGFKESSAGWEQPKSFGLPTTYKLSPSIVSNMKRSLVSVGSITRQRQGVYTVAFNKEIIGDIQLTVTVPKGEKQAVRVTEGEQLSSGVAKYKMGTGNVYDETWIFSGGTSTFTGFSLRGFRYVTLHNFPGELTANDIKGVKVSLSTADSEQSLSTGVEILDDVAELSQYTYEATTLDTVVDSVTRERRPYEGDALIYQALSYQNTDDYMTVRNTWNWLLDNPSQYTEYRMMTAIGIYRDYL
ncbi:family 78 glycoside hydrolase catalytic domain, partial [uncultured Bifidobacterium sp.]|uniref:family 78 glycoside hydrolase catalytic domain n=1 Tax=uncultured Bifidobacterium sp. TaxID=165187 RepID=UPI0026108853